MTRLLALALSLCVTGAFANPHAYARPVPASAGIKSFRVELTPATGPTINLPCDVVVSAAGVSPSCDLASVPAGTYTLVMFASNAPVPPVIVCTNAADETTCVTQGPGGESPPSIPRTITLQVFSPTVPAPAGITVRK